MIHRHTVDNVTWVDLESPTRDEVRQVMDEFQIHPIVGNELFTPTVRPRVEPAGESIYLILHFPSIAHKHGGKSEQEVDFVIGKDFLITTHYELIDPLHEFSKIFEANLMLDKSRITEHAGFLFFYLIRELYQRLGDELDDVGQKLEWIERRIFEGEEVEMVRTISETNRDLLSVKQAIRHHEEILESFDLAGRKLFGEDFTYYLRAIIGEYHKVANMLDGHKETLIDLRETNDSMLTTKSNEIIKVFTVLMFVMLPPSLVAALFSMNTQYVPIIGHPYDFWIIILLMIGATVVTYLYFKWKQWM